MFAPVLCAISAIADAVTYLRADQVIRCKADDDIVVSTGLFFQSIGTHRAPKEKLTLHKCLSCGAPLKTLSCDYCGGEHRMES